LTRTAGTLARFYSEFTGEQTGYPAMVHDQKLLVLRGMFTAEINRLGELLGKICAGDLRACRNFSPAGLREAMMEMAACLPVYRTYMRTGAGEGKIDPSLIKQAGADARCQRPNLTPVLFYFLCDVLSLHLRGMRKIEFVARFQQLTGPAMAKGVEDTAFYCFNRLLPLNEVGW